jgi:hypothetical protein
MKPIIIRNTRLLTALCVRRSVALGIIAVASLFISIASSAQTTYQDPKGRYTVEVPSGWHVEPDAEQDQINVRHGAAQVIIVVIQQKQKDPMTAKEYVDATEADFTRQCPTSRKLKSGTVTLAGTEGISATFQCSDDKSPAVAETSSVLTANFFLVGVVVISPISTYYQNLPLLDAIRDSLRITGNDSAKAKPETGTALAKTELDKACLVGVLAQEDCARQMGILLGQEGKENHETEKPWTGAVYRDPHGRFTFHVPTGWTATAEGDNGSSGVQLRSGASWINVMPADPAPSARQVVLDYEELLAQRQHYDRKPPFGSLGLLQMFGHGDELTYDHFATGSDDGSSFDHYVAGVGDIAGKSPSHLLLVSSIDPKQHASADDFLTVALSIGLGTQ